MGGVLVTTTTGTVSSAVADALAERGVNFRAGVRSPQEYEGPGDPVAFDFERPETWGRAFEGIDRLFLVCPPTVSTARVVDAADAAVRVGTEHVVYLSVLGAEKNPLLPHRRIERHLERAPVARAAAALRRRHARGLHDRAAGARGAGERRRRTRARAPTPRSRGVRRRLPRRAGRLSPGIPFSPETARRRRTQLTNVPDRGQVPIVGRKFAAVAPLTAPDGNHFPDTAPS